jgi:hypothetical protein
VAAVVDRWAQVAAIRAFVRLLNMTRRDDAGGMLEGHGVEDTFLDDVGDNTGDAGDRYQGSLWFGTTADEQARGQSLEQRLLEEEPDLIDDQEEGADLTGRRDRNEIRQLVMGGEGSHSRTDPELVGLDTGDAGLAAEESALHVISDRREPGEPTVRGDASG